jgi:hypothetical protein
MFIKRGPSPRFSGIETRVRGVRRVSAAGTNAPADQAPLVAPPYPGWACHVWQRICSIDDAPGGRPVRRRRSGTVRAARDEEARQGGRLRTCGHRRGRDRCCYIKETAPRKSAPATADWTAPGCAAERARVNTASARNAGARGTRRRAHREQKPDEPKFVSEREQREDHPHRKQVDAPANQIGRQHVVREGLADEENDGHDGGRRPARPELRVDTTILWFGPCGAFFHPGRLIQKPARAADVKNGRHRALATCSLLPDHPGRMSTTAPWRGMGNAKSNPPTNKLLASTSKYVVLFKIQRIGDNEIRNFKLAGHGPHPVAINESAHLSGS